MSVRPAAVLMTVAVAAALILGGCSSGTGASSNSDGEYGEQNGLEVGTVAPDFRLKNHEQQTIALSDYKGVKNVVLIFYPADFTPV